MLQGTRLEEFFPITPFFAPLSPLMIQKVMTVQEGKPLTTTISLRNQTLRSISTNDPTVKWARLYKRFGEKREEALSLTQEALKDGIYSTRWMIEQLSRLTPEKTKPLSSETISRWRGQGLLLYEKEDYPNEESAIALLTLRLLTAIKANAWTPKPPDEKGFWELARWDCWRQDGPSAPIITCPVPIPQNLPTSTLIWTDWINAAKRSDFWMRFGSDGCCRWAKVKKHGENLIWDVTEADLNSWGIDTSSYQKELQRDAPLTLHTLANVALLTLANERLELEQNLAQALETQLQRIA